MFLIGANRIHAQQTPPKTAASVQTAAWLSWELQNSTTKAGLRGIHAVGNGVAWASGTNGTVLRTEDGGYMWQSCAMPPGAEKLDFRGIWAWDANTAVAMSSGPGDLSRLYKTIDGCSSWKLLYTNPDKDGFWDAIVFQDRHLGLILGDPVVDSREGDSPAGKRFVILETVDGGEHWNWQDSAASDLTAGSSGEGAFAASNSALILFPGPESATHGAAFGSGGKAGAYVRLGAYLASPGGVCNNCVPMPPATSTGLPNRWFRSRAEPIPLESFR